MFRTIKVKLAAAEGNLEPILETAALYTKACQIALNYGFKKKTYNKSKINAGTYQKIREEMPKLPSALVQCARDQACEMLRREKLRTLSIKKNMQVRYDKRTFSFYPESGYVSLTTVEGRLKFLVQIYEHCKQYLNSGTYTYTNAQLIVRRGKVLLNIQCEIEGYYISTNPNNDILGIDRGILNIVTCSSDNSFVNSKHLRNVKGKYQYLKAKLQSLGTRSAKRKLKRLSGRERRFVLDTNHVIAKEIVQNKPQGIIVVEGLRIGNKKANGRRFNKLLGSWSYGQLLTLLKYKAEDAGKLVLEIDPKHTSQRCSKCGHIDKKNRKGMRFKCLKCGFELNADLNAARNIAQKGRALLGRLLIVNQPIVTPLIFSAVTSHLFQ